MTNLIESLRAKKAAEEAANERVTQAEEAKRAAAGELYRAEKEHDQARYDWRQQGSGSRQQDLERRFKEAESNLAAAKEAMARAEAEEKAARAARDELKGGVGIQALATVEPQVTMLKRQVGDVARLQQHLESKRSELTLARQGLERLRGETAAAAVDALLDGHSVKTGADKILRAEEARLSDLEGIVAELERRYAEAAAALMETREDVMALVREAAFAEASARQAEMIEKLKAVVASSAPRLIELGGVLRAAGGGGGFGGDIAVDGACTGRVYLFRPDGVSATQHHADLVACLRAAKNDGAVL